jgi:hypothetical protein
MWRIGLVYQTISTAKKVIERVQASRTNLLPEEFRRELIHLLSAATLADEDGKRSVNPLVA